MISYSVFSYSVQRQVMETAEMAIAMEMATKLKQEKTKILVL